MRANATKQNRLCILKQMIPMFDTILPVETEY
jgi:hypothetical protein